MQLRPAAPRRSNPAMKFRANHRRTSECGRDAKLPFQHEAALVRYERSYT